MESLADMSGFGKEKRNLYRRQKASGLRLPWLMRVLLNPAIILMPAVLEVALRKGYEKRLWIAWNGSKKSLLTISGKD